jgi:ABC-2 type transport system permease protein
MNSQPAASVSLNSPAAPRPLGSVPRPLYWSVRRELWENRSIYLAPLAVAALSLAGFLVATIGRALSTADLTQRRAILEGPYVFVTTVIMATTFVVSLIYCIDALYGERRDRSILFWKSLPVSDFTTVISKAIVVLVVLPALTFGIVLVTQWIMLLLSSLALLGSGLGIAALWQQWSWIQTSLFYHLLTVHVIWYAPIYAWLLLVSAWARRAPFLWAGVPALAIIIIERLVFSTSRFAQWLAYRLSGPEKFDMADTAMPLSAMNHLHLASFLGNPGLWFGLLFTALFLAAAVRIRRNQGPI